MGFGGIDVAEVDGAGKPQYIVFIGCNYKIFIN